MHRLWRFGCKLCKRSLGDSIVHESKWTSHVKRRNDSAHILALVLLTDRLRFNGSISWSVTAQSIYVRMGALGQWLWGKTDDWEVPGLNRACTASELWQFCLYPILPVFFIRDTGSLNLASARRRKVSRAGGECVICYALHILEKDNSEINPNT